MLEPVQIRSSCTARMAQSLHTQRSQTHIAIIAEWVRTREPYFQGSYSVLGDKIAG
jgi:hypothetical protein